MLISLKKHTILNFRKRKLLKLCLEELQNQSLNPPGNDIVIKSCYEAFLELLKNPVNERKINEILMKREFTPSHFANVFFRTVQFIELYQKGKNNYPEGFDNTIKWSKELSIILDENFDQLRTLLLTKDTTTTIYQRYAGSKIVLNSIFKGKSLAVADLGCGGNYGLPGLLKNSPFDPIIDHSKSSKVTALIKEDLRIVDALAIDKENPYAKESKDWRYSCSYYPHELKSRTEIIVTDSEESETIFTRFDLTLDDNKSGIIKIRHYDAAILSTFLYQLNYAQIQTVIEFAKKLIKKNGVIIIQDFAKVDRKDPTKLRLLSNWFSTKNPYRTFVADEKSGWVLHEILQWDSGRCREVFEGKDFEFISNR